MADKEVHTQSEIRSEVVDQFDESVREYFDAYNSKTGDEKQVPTISEIEELVEILRSKTRDIYLTMISDSLNSTDESELVASKKENI